MSLPLCHVLLKCRYVSLLVCHVLLKCRCVSLPVCHVLLKCRCVPLPVCYLLLKCRCVLLPVCHVPLCVAPSVLRAAEVPLCVAPSMPRAAEVPPVQSVRFTPRLLFSSITKDFERRLRFHHQARTNNMTERCRFLCFLSPTQCHLGTVAANSNTASSACRQTKLLTFQRRSYVEISSL